ncbi:related to Diphosphoinositol polyphosphate phosphohydrolase DDP1 [Saccharomycodes ludwigii]|uniref:Related to Diphosphoinositol polyphosphate phosphohydrolase DDP1 n=1 Tax=Saccharomycodes ludwigii TaxID=36035 RepID=A0A376BA05_9ASCO|nr:hypothetical protein SCDLUD_000921 [Saccharomycodes ludwigii]KAH3903296.1 hypothetical protein SCDLUD_000921 [Saccharomycodes ludwigii]SSD61515.1 related to Diphosphoinositol polyphosphate phosphohydrolase DDP1 [Saccharomycodes ludwigii]
MTNSVADSNTTKHIKFDKNAVSRVGRSNQVYSEHTGARLVAGCVCLNKEKTRVLLVQSTAHKSKWVLPKGGVEKDEYPEFAKTACRETWEEAGVLGTISTIVDLGIVQDLRPPKHWGNPKAFEQQGNDNNATAKTITAPPRSEFHFFEMIVDELVENYPERGERNRKWFNYEDALKELERAKRPELVEILKRSSLNVSNHF